MSTINDYRESDFRLMLFNVNLLAPEEDPLIVWPELRRIEEFHEPVAPLYTDMVLRYIFLTYDRNSPVSIRNRENLIKRKFEAAKLAGFELKDGKFNSYVEDMIKCKNEYINKMIFAFVRLFGDNDYAYLTSLMDALYSIMPDISAGEIKDMQKVQLLKKEIDQVSDRILVRDNTNSLYLDLYKYIEREKLGLRPEDMALKNNRGR
jgi:hypothetical protein